jgi:hypothetical protein
MNHAHRRAIRAAFLSVAGLAALECSAAPLQTMDEVGEAILSCWSPPAAPPGSSVTLSFSFKSDGTLVGPPRPTEIEVPGGAAAGQSYVDAAIAAVERCVPLDFSPEIAAGIAGQVFTLRFPSDGGQTITPEN